MSRFPPWHFRSMDLGEVHVDPVHDEFFKAQDLADALVRESIQNSLDARLPRSRSPVSVRFRFASGAQALPAEGVREYFEGLEGHLRAAAKSIHTVLPRDDESVPYLLIEDSGTRGLTGDPRADPELDHPGEERKNDFYYFWRNVGRSSKGDVDRGRWGLGKAVFTVASRNRTIFGITRRFDDNRALLLGQSVLKTHVLDGQRIYPYGFFARFEKRNGQPLPIEDPILLERFADDFGVNRVEPGLSIVVPYFRDNELSPERVTDSVVRQYFYPILRGDLVVDVGDEARIQRIDAETIETLSINNDNAARLCALTRWSLAQNDDARIVLPERDAAAPRWDESILDAATLASLRERFSSGERIAFRVPILVKRKRVRAASSWFDVYLEHDDALRKGEHRFIRRGITIPDVRVSTEKAARALIVIDDHPLSTFLGDAENPAHTDWSERADKVRTLYDHGPSTLRFVKNSASFLASLLSRAAAGRVRDYLADLFSIDVPEESLHDDVMAPSPVRAAAGESKPGTASTDATPASSGVTIARIEGGFTIKASDPAMVGHPLRGEIAYRVRAGNPFRKHSPFDFDLTSDAGITMHADGVRLRPTSVNAFELVPSAAKFLVSMRGFDPRRDLVVRLHDPLHDPDNAAETELH
ncbi:MAG TPA: hypothetical protein VN380_20065 [Thermoanaerobaculia bacterium]|nr:hypothetical protein [Thermoanaerobaculia bacterium]